MSRETEPMPHRKTHLTRKVSATRKVKGRAKRRIVYLSDALLITCIVQVGCAEAIMHAAQNAGAQGITVSYGRGSGIRERMGVLGVMIDTQKEVIRIIVSKEQSERIFEAVYLAGKLDEAGRGIMFMGALERVATHIPDDILQKLKM